MLGEVTMLVNNAGIVYGNSVLDSAVDQIEHTVSVNTLAHFWVCIVLFQHTYTWPDIFSFLVIESLRLRFVIYHAKS